MDAAQRAAELVSRLGARSERCLVAAEHLVDAGPELVLPRSLLLQAAVEYRLKSFLVAARGGAPDTRDLFRLYSLARLCGLDLRPDHLDLLDGLARDPAGPTELGAVAPPPVRSLCRHINGQQA